MVVGIIASVSIIIVLVLGLIWCNELRHEEIMTNKAKRDMYNKWYDLGVLIADIESKKIEKKEIK